MSERFDKYQIVYRGQTLDFYVPDGWVFFQRPKECGGGYWLGRTCDGFFLFGIERPVSLLEGIQYLLVVERVEKRHLEFDDDFTLF
ncbi:hypothetical protein [Dryocola sp. BD626]|uniref:hypothetical protein n=1 Tax=Dryocola sp. BD626 TaxID=3133273 RepID=UPI003F508D4A